MSENLINFYVRDDGIMVFEFHAMHRAAADLFAKIVRAGMQNVPDKLRVLYDFSHSDPPTSYFLQIQGKLYQEFPHPPDEKSAYVTDNRSSDVWVRVLRSYFPAKDVMRIFKTQDAAIAWLLDEVD